MKTARLRLRIIEKSSRETFEAYWPWQDGIAMCIKTGCIDVRLGQERNDRGEVIRTFDRFPMYVRF